ncbi:hypothetical protein HK096_000172 [Nowakowskiella sp. JEL0078]|nr:hypothetical protein HK096_000172 [Nowakowskiella sp. JEL0078]
MRSKSSVTIWPPSPNNSEIENSSDEVTDLEGTRKHEAKKRNRKAVDRSSSSSDSSSSRESVREKRKKKKKSKSKSVSNISKRKNNKKRMAKSSSSEIDSSSSSGEEETISQSIDARDLQTIEDYWKERNVRPVDDIPLGPIPMAEIETKLDERAYGESMLAGEANAIAAYVQSGKRIPRRGEIGLTADEIQSFENVGFVMSGSRHARMNAVRIRKENQVISAEEKRALLDFSKQEKMRKEKEVIGQFKELLDSRIKKRD